MSITQEQVADLQPGDVVEFRINEWPENQSIRTVLRVNSSDALVAPVPGDSCAGYWIRDPRGQAFDGASRTLTVISRAPRPLYVNHSRTEPVPGDVALPGDGTSIPAFYMWGPTGKRARNWFWPSGLTATLPEHGLRLLVDGETGMTVPQ